MAGQGDGVYRVYTLEDENGSAIGAFSLFGDAADAEEYFARERFAQAASQNEEGDSIPDEDKSDEVPLKAALTGAPDTLREILYHSAPLRLGELTVDGTLFFSDAARALDDDDISVDVGVQPGQYAVVCWLGLPESESQPFLKPIALMAVSGDLKKVFDEFLLQLSRDSLRDLAKLTWCAEGVCHQSHLANVRPEVLNDNFEGDMAAGNEARAVSWVLQGAEVDDEGTFDDFLRESGLSEPAARSLLRLRGIDTPKLSWLTEEPKERRS